MTEMIFVNLKLKRKRNFSVILEAAKRSFGFKWLHIYSIYSVYSVYIYIHMKSVVGT